MTKKLVGDKIVSAPSNFEMNIEENEGDHHKVSKIAIGKGLLNFNADAAVVNLYNFYCLPISTHRHSSLKGIRATCHADSGTPVAVSAPV